MSSPTRTFPVQARATATVMNATGTGILVGERTLPDPKRVVLEREVDPGWTKVSQSALAHRERFNVTLRGSLTKTQASVDAPAYLQIPEVRGQNSHVCLCA